MTSNRSAGAPRTDFSKLGSVIQSLSSNLDPERIGSGTLAELRRISGDSLPPAFWLLYLRVVPRELRERDGKASPSLDIAWAALIRAMVGMGARPHSFNHPFGRALADSGYSEARFVRLLRAERESLAREVRVAGEWLGRAGIVKVNWREPATLLLRGSEIKISPKYARLQIARDYFRAVAKQSSNK